MSLSQYLIGLSDSNESVRYQTISSLRGWLKSFDQDHNQTAISTKNSHSSSSLSSNDSPSKKKKTKQSNITPPALDNINPGECETLYRLLSDCLIDENFTIVQTTIMLIGELCPFIRDKKTNLQKYIRIILSNLILNLGNAKGIVRRSTLSTVVILVKNLEKNNVKIIIDTLVKHGLNHSDYRIRQGSILVIPQIISSNTYGLNLLLLLEHLCLRLKDSYSNVSISSQQALAHLHQVKPIEYIQCQLQLSEINHQLLNEYNDQIQQSKQQQFPDCYYTNQIQLFSQQRLSVPLKPTHLDVFFECLPRKTLETLVMCIKHSDWKNASLVTDQSCRIIVGYLEQQQNNSQISSVMIMMKNTDLVLLICWSLQKCISEIYALLSAQQHGSGATTMNNNISNNKKNNNNSIPVSEQLSSMMNGSLKKTIANLIECMCHLIPMDDLMDIAYLSTIIPLIIPKLSFISSMMSNHPSKSLLKQLCKLMINQDNSEVVISPLIHQLTYSFKEIREDTVKLLTGVFIEEHKRRQTQLCKKCDFERTIQNLCKCLNQSDPKLTYLILECISVIDQIIGTSQLNHILKTSTINALDLTHIRKRLSKDELPLLDFETFQLRFLNTEIRNQVGTPQPSLIERRKIYNSNLYRLQSSKVESNHSQSLSNMNNTSNSVTTTTTTTRSNPSSSSIDRSSISSSGVTRSIPRRYPSATVKSADAVSGGNGQNKFRQNLSLLKGKRALSAHAMSKAISNGSNSNSNGMNNNIYSNHYSNSSKQQLSGIGGGKTTTMIGGSHLSKTSSLSANSQRRGAHISHVGSNRSGSNGMSSAKTYFGRTRSAIPNTLSSSRSVQSLQHSGLDLDQLLDSNSSPQKSESLRRRSKYSRSARTRPLSSFQKTTTPSLSKDLSQTSMIVVEQSEDLERLENPQMALERCLRGLQSKQWDEQFRSMTDVRRLALFHSELLMPNLSDIVRIVNKEVMSLRSTVSKQALLTVKDLFNGLRKPMESHLDALSIHLLKKSGEMSNEFLTQVADQAWSAVIRNVSSSRSLSCLLHHTSNKTSVIRAKVALYLSWVVDKAGPSISQHRDYHRLLCSLGQLICDNTVNIRTNSQRIIVSLRKHVSHTSLDNQLKRLLKVQQYNRIQKFLKQQQHSGPQNRGGSTQTLFPSTNRSSTFS